MRSNLWLTLLVGTLLNLINQGRILLHLDVAHLHTGKFLLTYLVPFLVGTYSAARARMQFRTGDLAPLNAVLQCRRCRRCEVQIPAGETVPECPQCHRPTRWLLLREASRQS